MKRRDFTLAAAAGLGGEAMLSSSGHRPARAGASGQRIPDIEVITHEGRTARFYTDLVKDRVVTLNFFYTGCGETCPLVTENLRAVQDLLGERMGRDIFMYSISLQPELDTPAILRDHADQWQLGPGWRFLTGRPEAIERLRKATGFASRDPELDLIRDNHTGLLRYGNDRLDRWAGCPALARPEWIAKAITTAVLV
jgi:protein SCO1/2